MKTTNPHQRSDVPAYPRGAKLIRPLLSFLFRGCLIGAGLAMAPSHNATMAQAAPICPSALFADGCSGRVSGTPQNPNLLLPYGTNRPPWNVAGVDYRVGHSGLLKDPSIAGNLPSCATYGTAGGQNTVTINSVPCTIDHFDFTLRNGICLSVPAAVTSNGAFIVTNNSFRAGTGCQPIGGGIINMRGIVNATIRYNTFEQSYNPNFSNIIATAANGNRTIEYNVFLHADQHDISFMGSGTYVIRYNYAFGVGCCGHHGDWIFLGSTNFALTEKFNTVVQDRALKGSGIGATAFCYMGTFAGKFFTSAVCTHDTYISALGYDGLGHVSFPIRVEPRSVEGPGTIANNYIDSSGSIGPILGVAAGGTQTVSCFGNVDLRTGKRITAVFGTLFRCY